VSVNEAGLPVAETFTRAGLPCTTCPVLLTPGHAEGRDQDGTCPVPESVLGSLLVVLTESRRLMVSPALEHAADLTREMQHYQPRATSAGGAALQGWRPQDSEHLCVAVALACWHAESEPPDPGGKPLLLGRAGWRR
jgi:hypothetical protein